LEAHIPLLTSQTRRLKKKSWSSFLHSIDIATQTDMLKLNDNLLILRNGLHLVSDQIINIGSEFHSIQRLHAQHSNTINKIISQQVDISQKNAETSRRVYIAFIRVLHVMYETNVVDEQISELCDELNMILQNQLPLKMIKQTDFDHAVEHIRNTLSANNHTLYVLHDRYTDHIRLRNFVVTRNHHAFGKKNSLILTLIFPLSISRQQFKLYKVEKFEMPADQTGLHSSVLRELPRFIAINDDSDNYI
jgi:hypothetical protein